MLETNNMIKCSSTTVIVRDDYDDDENTMIPAWFDGPNGETVYYPFDLINGGIQIGWTGNNPLRPEDKDDGGTYILCKDGEIRCVHSIDLDYEDAPEFDGIEMNP